MSETKAVWAEQYDWRRGKRSLKKWRKTIDMVIL